MPNWTDNTLVILVPKANTAALTAALAGPADWHAPDDGDHFFPRATGLSSHQETQLIAWLAQSPETLRDLFRKDPINARWPAWMPISFHDMKSFAQKSLFGVEHTASAYRTEPFSVAALAPWTNKAEFDTLFPGIIDENGWWTPDPDEKSNYNGGRRGYIALRHAKLGVKWPPNSITLDTISTPEAALDRLEITFRTPWSQILTLYDLLWDVLETHQAKVLLMWEEEDMNAGWELLDPSNERHSEHTYERAKFAIPDEEYENEDDDEDPYVTWDSDAFRDHVMDHINDPDF